MNRESAPPVVPDRCRRCAHLATTRSHGHERVECLRDRPISATCGWWAPRRLGLEDR